MNETGGQAATAPPTTGAVGVPGGEALAMRQLQHVGAAYGLIFVLLLVFAWRASSATKRLSERIDELERERRHGEAGR